MNVFQYIVTSSACLSIFYIAYRLVFRNETNFRQLRAYLLISILLSILIPFNNIKINLDLLLDQNAVETTSFETLTENNPDIYISNLANDAFTGFKNKASGIQTIINCLVIIKIAYCILTVLLLARIFLQILFVVIKYLKSTRIKEDDFVLIRNDRTKNTYSFFKWIFLQTDFSSKEDLEQMISHEKIHAMQYHTFDLILIELLAAVMWFNPLVWMMRNSIQLVHEYLADEGALSTGIDKLKYQALLINQASEEKLICLSSSFNHSLIKKRMIMMTKGKFNQRTKLKILALVPATIVLFLGVACINGKKEASVVTAIEPVRMNVLYIGVDNPIKIAASGYEPSEINVSVTNGTITGKNGEYIVRPKMQGNAHVIVTNSKGKEIQKTEFRVKVVPDPVAMMAGLRGGPIKKNTLLEQDEIVASMASFEFDISFEIVEFTVLTVLNGYVYEVSSKSNKITPKQKELFNKLKPNDKLYFQDIKCKGPDGSIREMATLNFKIE